MLTELPPAPDQVSETPPSRDCTDEVPVRTPASDWRVHCDVQAEIKPLMSIHEGMLATPQSGEVILTDVKLQLVQSAHVALMGPSGSSKPSFLEPLIGLLAPALGHCLP